MFLWLCTSSVHKTTQNSSDNLPFDLQTTIIAHMSFIGGTMCREQCQTCNYDQMILFCIVLLATGAVHCSFVKWCPICWTFTAHWKSVLIFGHGFRHIKAWVGNYHFTLKICTHAAINHSSLIIELQLLIFFIIDYTTPTIDFNQLIEKKTTTK